MSTIIQSRTAVAFEPLREFLTVTASGEDILNYQEQQLQRRKHSVSVTELEIQTPEEAALSKKRKHADTLAEPQVASAVPSIQTALLITPERTYRLVSDFPAPQDLGVDEVMIRSRAVGLNHIDWKSVDYNFCLPELPWIIGREMAGVVERVGANVTKLKAGDTVWTSTYYKDRRAGCFQELVVVPQHTAFPVPASIDFITAACLGVGGLTAAMSLWQWLGVPMPSASRTFPRTSALSTQKKELLLVWGGSTITGQFAIQIAAQAGLDVIAVCSELTAQLVSGLGATHVVTYTDKTDFHIIGEILCLAQGRLTKAIDLVGAKTAKLVLQIITACGTLVDFAPLAFMSSKYAVSANAIVHTVEMKQFVLDPESEQYGVMLNDMIERKALRMPKVRLLEGGLGAVEQGLRRMKNGDLAGEKLVVSIS